MQHSGLSDKEQWALLNTTAPLSALNQHNQAQNAVETRATAAKIATTLMSATTQAAIPRAPVTASKPTNSTPLQTTAQQRKLDMEQEEYETRFYEKQARRPIAVNAQNNTPKTPAGAKPVVDSRDAMEQKKDRVWDKIESTYNPRDAMDRKKDEIWEKVNLESLADAAKPTATPLPQPGASPDLSTSPTPHPSIDDRDTNKQKYNWYSTYDEAVNAWANSFWRLSKDFEHCALVYKRVDENGNEVYTFGETKIGSKGLPPLFQPNVVTSLADLYFNEKIPDASLVGFIHSHPEPPKGYTYKGFSSWDLALKNLLGIDYVTLAPYENGNTDPMTK